MECDSLFVNGTKFGWSDDGVLSVGKVNGAEELKQMFGHDYGEFLEGPSREGIVY